ncbi:hypothetical protein DBR06_SOUSAS10610027, partial [Sousa chinensis]
MEEEEQILRKQLSSSFLWGCGLPMWYGNPEVDSEMEYQQTINFKDESNSIKVWNTIKRECYLVSFSIVYAFLGDLEIFPFA